MKPKKIVLLVCSNDNRRSELSFLLTLKGYRVIGGISKFPPVPNLALFVDGPESESVAQVVDELHWDLPLLVMIREPRRYVCRYPARAFFVAEKVTAAELIERVKVLGTRKRGPKKARPVWAQRAVTA